jgi:hypothetical protein
VHYVGETVTASPPIAGCAYAPREHRDAIERDIARDERIARGDRGDLPIELACNLSEDVRRAAASQNARTLRATLDASLVDARVYPYATIATFGFGHYTHEGTALDAWRPGDACPAEIDLHRFGTNVDRATRAALAWEGGVAPFIVTSGGAIHSHVVESFLLDYIATCRIGVPRDRVLVDPCANHTHTNVRNTGRLLRATGGRTGYIVTDDFQGAYLRGGTLFDAIGGSIDARSMRDFGYLLGTWEQASRGIDAGFWFTPYRFWSDARLRDFACPR